MNHNKKVSFHEVQKFQKSWIRFLLIALTLFFIILFGYGMLKQLVFGQPWGNKPMSDIALVIVSLLVIFFMVGMTILFYVLKLVTEVKSNGVYINFFPLSRQKVLFQDIKHCEARTYNAVKEYGGWGIRYGRKGKAYNISSNRGVQLSLSNGKLLLIGSQRSEELALAIAQRMKK